MGRACHLARWVAGLAGAVLLAAGPSQGWALEHDGPVLSVALKLELAADVMDPRYRAELREMQDRLLEDLGPDSVRVVRRFELVPGLALQVIEPSVVPRLAAHPLVRAVGPDEGGHAHLNLSAPFVGATAARLAGLTGVGRVVAVIDSGVDTDHPDLASDLLGGACFCTATPTCCGAATTGIGLSSTEDDAGHGTHVTGIITSAGQVAPLGIAPDADVVVVRVMNSQNFAATSDIIAGIEWVRLNYPQVDALNLSLGTTALFPSDCDVPAAGYNPPAFMINFKLAFDVARQAGMLPISSAGNDGSHSASGAPGCLSNVFTVGSTDNAADIMSGFSNSTAAVDLWAPGGQIQSSFIFGTATSLNGTSMATPHATAAVALIQQNNASHPVPTIERCLQTSAVTIVDPVNGLSRPRLDIVSAVAACGSFALGEACTLGPECQSGFCADGVCCNSACGGGSVDCLACSQTAGAQVDGQCTVVSAGLTCRPSQGDCDLPELCDGLGASCPADAWRAAGQSCRPSAGACDLPEACTGTGPQCPPNARFGGICRPAVGACDRPESCDGVRDLCPADELWGSSIECRGSAGPCDVAELCDGLQPVCPVDALGVGVCRAAAGPCDAPEQCDGVQASCPPDQPASAGVTCRPARDTCDQAEVCDGQGVLCPQDAFAPAGAACRPAAGDCDVAEVCDGLSVRCPQDGLREGLCRPAAGPCDVDDWCDGRSVECGPDRVKSSTVTCRAAAQVCDVPELCDGQTPRCPPDGLAADGQACADGLVCNGQEVCRNGACVPSPALDCDDGDACTVGQCEEPGGCRQVPVPGCCHSDAECDAAGACSSAVCVEHLCRIAPIDGCCTDDTGCEDEDPCSEDRCVQGRCEHNLASACQPDEPEAGCACSSPKGQAAATSGVGGALLTGLLLGLLRRRRHGVGS